MTTKKPASHLPLRPVEFFTLATLVDLPLHGYAMVQEIEKKTGGKIRLRPGDLYRVLARLEGRGLLEEAHRRPAPDADDERRTYYQLTPQGQRVLQAEAELMAQVSRPVLARFSSEVSP